MELLGQHRSAPALEMSRSGTVKHDAVPAVHYVSYRAVWGLRGRLARSREQENASSLDFA